MFNSFQNSCLDIGPVTALATFIPCLIAVLAWLGVQKLTQAVLDSQGLLWETSLLDPEEGIRFRGFSIPELQVCLAPLSLLHGRQRRTE